MGSLDLCKEPFFPAFFTFVTHGAVDFHHVIGLFLCVAGVACAAAVHGSQRRRYEEQECKKDGVHCIAENYYHRQYIFNS